MRLLQVSQLADEIEGLSEQAIRWHIFNAKNNGLDELGAIKRVGRRVLIDVELFYRWIDALQVGTAVTVKREGPRKIAQARQEA